MMAKKTEKEKILVYVAGVTYEGRQKPLKRYYLRYTLGKRIRVKLEREPKNEHDKYAVKVVLGKKCVGYIPKKVSKLISKAIRDNMIKRTKLHDIHINEMGIYSASIMLHF
jgi:hypothetical protein